MSTLYLVPAIALVLFVALPLVRSPHWTVRVFDYPRVQKLVLVCLMLGLWFTAADGKRVIDQIVLALLMVSALYLVKVIVPYTPLGQKMVDQVVPNAGEAPLTLLVCNVLQTNRDHGRLGQLIAQRSPDVVVLLETDEHWQQGIRSAVSEYPYRVEVPQPNTYGMLLYSRLPIVHQAVNRLVDPEVPSIIADVDYRGARVRLYILHPTPPVPQENETSTERDAEVLLVGRMAQAYGKPCIVLGDLNDVAWSRTTELFLKSSKMLDPRRGRGMYNTFHAHVPFLRWPLDHFFVSSQFRLVDVQVESSVGSDHFPMSLAVVLRADDPREELPIAVEEHQEVSERIAAAGA